jgi:hypothetical protein
VAVAADGAHDRVRDRLAERPAASDGHDGGQARERQRDEQDEPDPLDRRLSARATHAAERDPKRVARVRRV